MKDTPTPASTVRKARRRVATVSADRPGAALPIPAEINAEQAASGDGVSFWAAPWRYQVDFWQRSALFLDVLRQRAGANNPWLAGDQAPRMISDGLEAYRRWRDETPEAMFAAVFALMNVHCTTAARHHREAIVGGAHNRVFGRLL